MAAYELDKLLDLGMIPPTVEKRVKNDLGAAVLWVSPVRSFKQMERDVAGAESRWCAAVTSFTTTLTRYLK